MLVITVNISMFVTTVNVNILITTVNLNILVTTVTGKKFSGASELENLPEDLKELVAFDNKLFSEEIEKWDREQSRKAMGAGDADISVISEQTPGNFSATCTCMCTS